MTSRRSSSITTWRAPHYPEFWGDHLHHGYWATGSESKEEAQSALVAHLADKARIPLGASILDVGCGVGASSIYLAEEVLGHLHRYHHLADSGGDGT